MRRLTSALLGAATVIGLITVTANAAAAAGPGTVTESTTNAIPSTPADLKVFRITRLSRTGEFLVVGRVNTAGSKYYVWQLKPDYTIDTTFGTAGMVDTGVVDPATCTINNNIPSGNSCSQVRALTYNEVSNTYVLFINRTIVGTSYTHQLGDVVVGDLKTGAVKTKSVLRDVNYSSSTLSNADFNALNLTVQDLARQECTTVNGASVNGAYMRYASFNQYSSYILPNGSFVTNITCDYSTEIDSSGSYVNTVGLNLKEYTLAHMSAFKVVNGALALDTTWGTSGRLSINAADSGKCINNVGMTPTTDLGITSMSSTKPYLFIPIMSYPRQTTTPNSFSQIASYDGCNTNSSAASSVQYSSKLISVTAAGKTADAMDLGTGNAPLMPSRWVIDPAGRWVSLVRSISAVPSSQVSASTYTAVRLVNGKGDPTFGTNGQKTMSLQSTVTVNGTTVAMNYSISGMITTQDEVLFTGLVSSSSQNSYNCSTPGTVTSTARPFVLSMKNGAIDTTYGTNGLGDAISYQFDQTDMCSGGWGGATFVTSKGQPAQLRGRPAIGSQTKGIFAYVWETVANATGGGDGGTGTGGATKDTGGAAFTGEKNFAASITAGGSGVAGRIDAKVYTKAPAKVQENSSVSVLKASEVDDLDIVTTTPKVCIALTTSVVFTGTGKCTVRIIDEETRKVIRTFSTTVTKAEQTAGTVLTSQDPIMFRFVSSALTLKAKAQVAALAKEATTVGRVLIIGHSASLYDNEISNKYIALRRAAAVKAALIKAGVKAPISIVSVGSADPVSTTKTEAAQAKNRRVEVFLFPAAG